MTGLIRRTGVGAIEFASQVTRDEAGRVLSYKRFNGDPADPAAPITASRLLEYDGQGNLIAYFAFSGDVDDPSSSLIRMYLMTYDGSGNRVGLRHFDFIIGPSPLVIAEWTYDENGNPLTVALPLDERLLGPAEAIADEDPLLPQEPDVPAQAATFSNYFPAPFDIVPAPRGP